MSNETNETPQLSPESKKNIKLMVALVVMLLIGIIVRWDYIKKELTDTYNNYVERITTPPTFSKDTVDNNANK